MVRRVILFWLLGTNLAFADFPPHSKMPATVNQYRVGGITLPNEASIINQYDDLSRLTNTALLNYWGHPLDGCV